MAWDHEGVATGGSPSLLLWLIDFNPLTQTLEERQGGRALGARDFPTTVLIYKDDVTSAREQLDTDILLKMEGANAGDVRNCLLQLGRKLTSSESFYSG